MFSVCVVTVRVSWNQRKPTFPNWLSNDHLTCWRRVSNLGWSCERTAPYQVWQLALLCCEWSIWRKPTYLSWWPHDHLACWPLISNLGLSRVKTYVPVSFISFRSNLFPREYTDKVKSSELLKEIKLFSMRHKFLMTWHMISLLPCLKTLKSNFSCNHYINNVLICWLY